MQDYFESDEFKETLQQYEQSRKTGRPAYLDALDYVDLSDYYLNQDDTRKALQAINQGLKAFPNNTDLLAAKAGAYMDDGYYERARGVLAKIPAKADCPERRYVQACLALCDDYDLDNANQLFHQWIDEVDKKYADRLEEEDIEDYRRHCHAQIIIAYYEQNEFDNYDDEILTQLYEWIQLYLDKWKTMGEYEADFSVAETCCAMSHTQAIEEVYKRLLDHDPYVEKGWETLAVAQFLNQHYADALDSAAYALAIDPENQQMVHVQADCQLALNHFDQALALYNQFLQSDDAKELSPQELCSIEMSTARCLMASEDKEGARKHLDAASAQLRKVKLGATVPNARPIAWMALQLARDYAQLGEHRKGLAAVHKALKCAPRNLDCQLMENLLQMFLGNEEKLQRFIDNNRSNPTNCAFSFIILAQLILSLGSPQHAKQLLLEYVNALEEGTFDDACLDDEPIDSFTTDGMQLEDGYAQLCLAAYLANDFKTLRQWLPKAQEHTPQLLTHLFNGVLPNTIEPGDYFTYLSTL